MTDIDRRAWGQTRKKLAARLRDLGFEVIELWAAQGHYRSDSRADCWRWEGLIKGPDRIARPVGCYNTMTDCVRFGLTVKHDGQGYEAHAKPAKRDVS